MKIESKIVKIEYIIFNVGDIVSYDNGKLNRVGYVSNIDESNENIIHVKFFNNPDKDYYFNKEYKLCKCPLEYIGHFSGKFTK